LKLTNDRRRHTGVSLYGGRSYLESCPLLDRLGVRVHSLLRILLCIDCGAAFTPQDMLGHLRKVHSLQSLTAEDQNAFFSFSTSHNVGKGAMDGPLPANHGPPVELVRVQPGFACAVSPCPYAAPQQQTVVRHRREVHSSRRCQREENVMVQTLFPAVGKTYFIVNPTLVDLSQADPYTILVTSVLPSIPPLEEQAPAVGREIPPFHRVTQWWDMLGDLADSRHSRLRVIALAAVPGTSEPTLHPVLPRLCQEYLVEAQNAAKQAGYTVRRRLVPDQCVIFSPSQTHLMHVFPSMFLPLGLTATIGTTSRLPNHSITMQESCHALLPLAFGQLKTNLTRTSSHLTLRGRKLLMPSMPAWRPGRRHGRACTLS
jgi:hypothetical protein